MKKISALKLISAASLIFACSRTACSELRSPLPSDVPGITIPNAHLVGQGGPGLVLRGNAPRREEIQQLKTYGITDILIFKKQTSSEVVQEIESLQKAGYAPERIRQIPFLWKDFGSFQETCEMTVQGLRVLSEIRDTPRRGVFFHCTVGEDRTGYLAGLFRMLAEGWDTDRAFRQELCGRGYEAGDPGKAPEVVAKIRAGLTPAYLKMAYLISNGLITRENLDASACGQEPVIDAKILAKFQCRVKAGRKPARPKS
jgi:hypothetical protein